MSIRVSLKPETFTIEDLKALAVKHMREPDPDLTPAFVQAATLYLQILRERT